MHKEKKGIYGKYILEKADGSELDSESCYFVLRLDTDFAAQEAALSYADHTTDKTLAEQLQACVYALRKPPCGCREASCPHESIFSPIWRVGESYNE